jgi:hypothetical protein
MSHALPPLPEPPSDEADPWDDFRRGLLTAIQVAAMGLVACDLALMYMDDKLKIPTEMCTEATQQPQP